MSVFGAAAVVIPAAVAVLYWVVLVDGGCFSSGGSAEPVRQSAADHAAALALAKQTFDQCSTCRSLRLEWAAAHEAAHAVVGVAVGLEVRSVELYPGGLADAPDVWGITHLTGTDAALTGCLAAIWAGPVAHEHLPCLQRLRGHCQTDHHFDVQVGPDTGALDRSDDTIREAGEAARHKELTAASRQLASRLVADLWDVIEQVAGRLLAADAARLGGAEVHRLCRHISQREISYA